MYQRQLQFVISTNCICNANAVYCTHRLHRDDPAKHQMSATEVTPVVAPILSLRHAMYVGVSGTAFIPVLDRACRAAGQQCPCY